MADTSNPLPPVISPGWGTIVAVGSQALTYGVPAGETIVSVEGVFTAALSTNPIGWIILAVILVLDFLEWIGVIPDPIELLLSLFVGRPKEEATVQVIQRLAKSVNPSGRLAAIVLSRILTDWGIVISASSAGDQKILGMWFHQFRTGLANQGVSWERAGTIVVNSLSRQAQAGAPLPPELLKPLPANFVLQGDTHIQDVFKTGMQRGTNLKLTGLKLQKFAEQYTWNHARIIDLLCAQWINQDWIPGTQPGGPPPPPPPPPSNQCPVGFVMNPQTEQCEPVFPPINNSQLCWCWNPQTLQWEAAPPSVPLQPGQGGDDELGNLGDQLCKCLDQIASAISGQNPQAGSPGDCCAQVVSSISAVAAQLAIVADEIAASAARDPTAVNLDTTPIATALENLKASLDLLPGNADANTSRLVEAINNSGGTDVSQIVEALNRPETTPALPPSAAETAKAIAQWVADNCGLDPAATQLITS
jgi:hypothetical protein